MQDLAEGLEENADLLKRLRSAGDKLEEAEDPHGKAIRGLRQTAINWSAFCIADLEGSSLELGMNISTAISLFCNSLED